MNKFLRFIFVKIPLALIILSVLWVTALKFLPVLVTPLMIERFVQFRGDDSFHTTKKWVPLEEISPNIMKAVIASEDNLFAKHNGFDRKAVEDMIRDHREKGKKIRGCSTISQQTAKNVFTSGKPTILRKLVEAWYTFLIEKIWGKQRIMEVYLNVAEMGKGIYGVQAASQTYFKKDAAKLTMRESCLIAACLPNPVKRNPSRPTKYLEKRQGDIASLTRKIEYPDWIR